MFFVFVGFSVNLLRCMVMLVLFSFTQVSLNFLFSFTFREMGSKKKYDVGDGGWSKMLLCVKKVFFE